MGQRCRGKQEARLRKKEKKKKRRQRISAGLQCPCTFSGLLGGNNAKFFFTKTEHIRTDKSFQMLIKIMEVLMLPSHEMHS